MKTCYYHVLFPNGSYVINKDTGLQDVPMVNMGKIRLKNKKCKPCFDGWARVARNQMPEIYFMNKDAGDVKNIDEFMETVLRAKRQPDLIHFDPLTKEEWDMD